MFAPFFADGQLNGVTNYAQVDTCTSIYWTEFGIGARVQSMGRQAVLRALAEPRRQAILRLVKDRPRSVGEIGQHFEISQQAVSQHLQVLADAGLVDVSRDGKRRLYVVNPDGLEELERFLASLWPSGLRRLKKAVESHRGR
jgi:DNA-binding transcriptional ArsR family regulator